MTASGGGFFNSNYGGTIGQLGQSINNQQHHSRKSSQEDVGRQEIRNVNTGGCMIEILDSAENSEQKNLADAFLARK